MRVAKKRRITGGRVFNARGIATECNSTNGRVKIAGGVVPERCSANSGEMRAGGVHEKHSKANGQVEVDIVVGERLAPMAILKLPVVLFASAPEPIATF